MREIQTEVIGTVRQPDGDPRGEIDGLVIDQLGANGGNLIITKAEAIRAAERRLLWTRAPNGRDAVAIEAVDRDGDGRPDYVHTCADHTRENNLLRLRIYDRVRQVWLDCWGRAA